MTQKKLNALLKEGPIAIVTHELDTKLRAKDFTEIMKESAAPVNPLATPTDNAPKENIAADIREAEEPQPPWTPRAAAESFAAEPWRPVVPEREGVRRASRWQRLLTWLRRH